MYIYYVLIIKHLYNEPSPPDTPPHLQESSVAAQKNDPFCCYYRPFLSSPYLMDAFQPRIKLQKLSPQQLSKSWIVSQFLVSSSVAQNRILVLYSLLVYSRPRRNHREFPSLPPPSAYTAVVCFLNISVHPPRALNRLEFVYPST